MGYVLSYPDVAFAFSPCYLTLTADTGAVDMASLSGYSLSETRYQSSDKIKFDLRPFILAALSVTDPLQVNYNKDIDTGLFKKIILSLDVEGRGISTEQESVTISINAAFGAIDPLDNMANTRKLPYNSNYPWSLDITTDSSVISVQGLYNYALGTGSPITREMDNSNATFHDVDQEAFSTVGDLYISFDADISILSAPGNIHYFIGGHGPFFMPTTTGSFRVEHQFKVTEPHGIATATYPTIGGVVGGRAKVTVRNMIVSKYPTKRWCPNPLDIQRPGSLSERRMPTVSALGFKSLPNPITLCVEDSLNGLIGTVGREEQYITIYPDTRKEGVYLRWLDKFGRICYRLLQQANKTLQVAANNSFSVEADYSIGYFNAVKGHPGDSEYAINTAQQTLKLGEQMCDKYAIQELMSLAASQFVQMYVNNGGNKMWLRVNVVPGSYTLKGSTLQEFSITIKLPKESIQHL